MDEQMNQLMGIGPVHSFSADTTKTLRVGTVKQLKDVGAMYKDGLITVKAAVFKGDEEQINKWVEILSVICVEGFTREEFEDSVPEQMESAVDRFLFGQ